MSEQKTLSSEILEALRAKGLSLPKLSQMTGISERVLETFINEEYQKLPAAPYIRGYLMQISKSLDLNGQLLWQKYLRGNEELKSSGGKDELPKNRFLVKKINSGIVLSLVIFLGIAFYVLFQIYGAWAEPNLEIFNVEDLDVIVSRAFLVEGRINPGDVLFINEEKRYTDKMGEFGEELILSPGLNYIDFKVRRFLGKEARRTLRVFFEPEPQEEGGEVELQEGEEVHGGDLPHDNLY